MRIRIAPEFYCNAQAPVGGKKARLTLRDRISVTLTTGTLLTLSSLRLARHFRGVYSPGRGTPLAHTGRQLHGIPCSPFPQAENVLTVWLRLSFFSRSRWAKAYGFPVSSEKWHSAASACKSCVAPEHCGSRRGSRWHLRGTAVDVTTMDAIN